VHSASSLDSVSLDFLLCRGVLRHAWEFEEDSQIEVKGGRVRSWVTRVVCGRCGTRRRQVISLSSGERSRAQYRYPDGYSVSGHVSRDEVLLATIGQLQGK
jgi:hypothetical protein